MGRALQSNGMVEKQCLLYLSYLLGRSGSALLPCLLYTSLGLFTAALFPEHPLSRSYGVNLPSSLTTLLPLALESSSYLPVSVCGTGTLDIHKAFLASAQSCFATLISLPYARVYQRPGHDLCQVSPCLNLSVATEYPPYVHRLRLSASP